MAWLSSMNSTLAALTSGPVARLHLADEVHAKLLELIGSEHEIIIETDSQKMQAYDAALTQERLDFDALLDQGDQISTPDEKTKYTQLRAIWETIKPLDSQLRALALSNKNDQATALAFGPIRATTTQGMGLANALVTLAIHEMQNQQDQAGATYAATRNVLIMVAVAAVLAALVAAIWLALTINRGPSKIATLAGAVAIGDLNMQVQSRSNDEINNLITTVNRMCGNLSATAAIADRIADGDLTVQPKPLSGKRHAQPGAGADDRAAAQCGRQCAGGI